MTSDWLAERCCYNLTFPLPPPSLFSPLSLPLHPLHTLSSRVLFPVVPFIFPHSLIPTLPQLTPTHSLPHSLTPSLLQSYTHSLLPLSLPHSLTSSLTPSLPHSLTPTLHHYLTPTLPHPTLTHLHSLTPSLPHSLTPTPSHSTSLPDSPQGATC